MKPLIALLAVSVSSVVCAADRPDVLVADFESDSYGDWKVEGNAFGTAPAKGTLPGQMHVEGFEGERLVNSFVGGDDATGTLTSPTFKLERKYLNFLIGGGGYEQTAIELSVDGRTVRKASGPNTVSGGSERLDWKSWDIADLAGKTATIRIVDQRKGGWGHINLDHIVQSDRKRQAEPASRELQIATKYLHLPVKTGAQKRRVKFVVNDETVREFEIELADNNPDLFVFSDVASFAGKSLTIEVDALPADSQALEGVVASDEPPDGQKVYTESLRPQFHFTSRRGWLNDPNGLVFHDGEWHLFYQHNPFGVQWGNMHWGHAVSTDLFHWKELPIALYPKEFGDWAFSGSAVVDHENTSGFGASNQPPLVLAYTSTGRGECVAYSNDRGRTWTEYEGNPVVRHQGRDPKLIWHHATKSWVMAVYQEKKEGDERDGQFIAFYSSPDLKSWKYESRIEGFFECPDLFPLSVEGSSNRQWLLYGADGEYMLGDFDGKRFNPSTGKLKVWYGNFYAAQSFDNAPEGRRVQIGWGRGIEFPGMPFNQQMVVPAELTLRNTGEDARLFAAPVREIEGLRGQRQEQRNVSLASGVVVPFEVIDHDLFDIEATMIPGETDTITFRVKGVPVVWNAKRGEITCKDVTAPLKPRAGNVQLRVLVDRGSIEVFGNDGEVALSMAVIPETGAPTLSMIAEGGEATIQSLIVHELKSSWRD